MWSGKSPKGSSGSRLSFGSWGRTSSKSLEFSTGGVVSGSPKAEGNEPKLAEVPRMRIVVLGDGGVGKSCTCMRFTNGFFAREHDATIEDMFMKRTETADGSPVQVELLDTAGQEDYQSLRDNWYRSGDGFVLMYSIDSRESFENIELIYRRLCMAQADGSGGSVPPPVVLVGNKCDLEEGGGRVVTSQEGVGLAREWNSPFLEVSAKMNTNIDMVFTQMIKEIATDRTILEDMGVKSARSGGDVATGLKTAPKPAGGLAAFKSLPSLTGLSPSSRGSNVFLTVDSELGGLSSSPVEGSPRSSNKSHKRTLSMRSFKGILKKGNSSPAA